MDMKRFDLDTTVGRICVDAFLFVTSFTGAYTLAQNRTAVNTTTYDLLLWAFLFVVVRLCINSVSGVYRRLWRYVALIDAFAIVGSLLAGTLLLLLSEQLLIYFGMVPRHARMSPNVFAIEICLTIIACLGVRALWKAGFEFRLEHVPKRSTFKRRRTILYGAGRAGMLLWKELKNHPEIEVLGFADDDSAKLGSLILGKRVLCNRATLPEVVRSVAASEVVISIASAPQKELFGILQRCREIPIPAKIIPSLQEIVDGNISIAQLREVSALDVLGRDKIDLGQFDHLVRSVYGDRNILVTGAGGSIGSELVSQVVRQNPASIILLDKDENGIYELEQNIRSRHPHVRLVPVIADIRSEDRLSTIFSEFKPEVVFHAAAHKHVPLMEKNPSEAILNNVLGTQTLLNVCKQHTPARLIFISSDKAVNPCNVMGSTKRIGELMIHEFSASTGIRSACVRFGNVLNSRGSVVPLFQKQIAEGGPITITDADMVRYFMTITEAVQLVLCAGTLADKGDIFVLDMGTPRKIADLAREMIALSGFSDDEIKMVVTGRRPGEKLYEELLGADEQVRATEFNKISCVVANGSNKSLNIQQLVETIQRAARSGDDLRVRTLLRESRLLDVSVQREQEALLVDS